MALPNDSILTVCTQNRRIIIDAEICWDINSSSQAIIITDLDHYASQMLWWFFDINIIGVPGWKFIVDYQWDVILS